MKDRIANCLCVLAAFAVVLFVGTAATNKPVVARQKAEPVSCLWEWTAFGWVIRNDQCFGFCNYPDTMGAFIGDLTTTPCVGK